MALILKLESVPTCVRVVCCVVRASVCVCWGEGVVGGGGE